MLSVAILCVIVALLLVHHSKSKFKQFSSPGFCLPILGHFHIFLLDSKIRTDPLNGIWDLYKRHQKSGMMHMKTLSLDTVWIGDFDTIKHLFNRSEVTGRLNDRQAHYSIMRSSNLAKNQIFVTFFGFSVKFFKKYQSLLFIIGHSLYIFNILSTLP